MRVLDLFSGIGGFSLGLEGTGGFQTVAFCEIEPFPRAVLRKHWPDVPIHEDVRELRGETVGPVDMICGGFPCQDISVAGKGAGLHGSRSGLWFEAARLVGELRPRWCLFENVGALRTRGIDRVCSDLEGEGYAVWTMLVGAWAVGAPHRRERVWIVAHRQGAGAGLDAGRSDDGGRSATEPEPQGCQGRSGANLGIEASDSVSAVGQADRHGDGQHRQRSGGLLDGERAAPGHDADGRCEWPVGSPTGAGLAHGRLGTEPARAEQPERHGPGMRWPARPGEPQHEWEEPRLAYGASGRGYAGGRNGKPGPTGRNGTGEGVGESGLVEQPMGGAVDGLPARLVRLARRGNRESLKAYGNSVVPQLVAAVGRAILAAEAGLDV